MSSGSSDDAALPPEELETRLETCRIRLWKGYVTGMFYASLLDDAAGEEESVCEPSGSFRWRGRDVSEKARAAHADVVSRLEAAGWASVGGEDDPWYATTFTRTVLVPRAQREDEDEPFDELESAPEAPVAPPPAPAPPPVPESTVAREAPPPPAAKAREPRRVDVWRVTAAIGLAAAVVIAILLAVHEGVALP
jgi:hypothetical protein